MSKAKQAILRVVAIKLEVETHKKYCKVLSRITWVLFVVFLGVGLFNSIVRYNENSEIYANVEYADASVTKISDDPNGTSLYRYQFSIEGEIFESEASISHNSAAKYIGDAGVQVAYNKHNPDQSNLAYVVKKYGRVGSVIKHFLVMFFMGGLGFMVIYMFLTNGIVQPVEEYDQEDEE